MANSLENVDTLTFDIFGTVLDLTGSLVPPIRAFLDGRDTDVDADTLWAAWRARQRVEQYQDALLMVGHSGYQESCRRAFVYCLRDAGVPYADAEVAEFMGCYQDLAPFDDAVRGLHRLRDSGRYRLVALSNGEPDVPGAPGKPTAYEFEFDAIISVQEGGAFKPHPGVYRAAARILESEPHRIMMVAAHSFDIMGARASGYRGAFVNRYALPFEETSYQPDLVVDDFTGLGDRLLGA